MNSPTIVQAIAALALAGFLLLLATGSGIVWWQAIARLAAGRPPLPGRTREAPRWDRAGNVTALVLTIAFILFSLASRLRVEVSGLDLKLSLGDVVITAVVSLLLVALLLGLLATGGRASLASKGIDPAGLPQQMMAGCLGFLASVLPVFAAIAATIPFRTLETQHPFFKILQGQSGLVTAFWIIGAAVITAPLAEELVFRVIFQGWLQTRLRPRWAILITAVLFAAVHGWPDALPLLPLALLLGYVFHQTHSYLAVVVMHAAFNSMNMVIALVSLLLQD